MKVSKWLDRHGSSLGILVGQSKYPPTLPNPFLSSPTVTFSLPASSWNQAFGLSHDIILIILILICFPKAFCCNESGENVMNFHSKSANFIYSNLFCLNFPTFPRRLWCLSAMATPPSPHSTWPAAHRGGENVQRPCHRVSWRCFCSDYSGIYEAGCPHVVAEPTYLFIHSFIYLFIYIYIYLYIFIYIYIFAHIIFYRLYINICVSLSPQRLHICVYINNIYIFIP